MMERFIETGTDRHGGARVLHRREMLRQRQRAGNDEHIGAFAGHRLDSLEAGSRTQRQFDDVDAAISQSLRERDCGFDIGNRDDRHYAAPPDTLYITLHQSIPIHAFETATAVRPVASDGP
ncbi:hypothetical protein CHELA1G11_12552 [Hyphomicrobiales bacterium]|nr:hypothetical protein CHELA1G2_11755 [Hyphomicrobiales bacterium]CAH1665562.1 hypothetical protein CHELA1G11_12552 [Hyphomicrobiales bacterium]